MNHIISLQMNLSDQIDLAIQAYCHRKGLPHGHVVGELRAEVRGEVATFFKYCSKNLATQYYWSQDDLVSLVGAIMESYERGYAQALAENRGER